MKEIPLTCGKVAIVDDEDSAALSQFTWYAKPSRSKWYAERNGAMIAKVRSPAAYAIAARQRYGEFACTGNPAAAQ